jgi:hypothetical protein
MNRVIILTLGLCAALVLIVTVFYHTIGLNTLPKAKATPRPTATPMSAADEWYRARQDAFNKACAAEFAGSIAYSFGFTPNRDSDSYTVQCGVPQSVQGSNGTSYTYDQKQGQVDVYFPQRDGIDPTGP